MLLTREEHRLCPSIAKCQTCQYGDKCRYPHDIAKWLAHKPADIATNCYIFDTYGHCPYGLACRFGTSSHIKQLGENLFENVKKLTENGDSQVCRVYNVLGSDLRTKLWKRKYDFSLSEKILKRVNSVFSSGNSNNGTLKFNRHKGTLQLKKKDGAVEGTQEEEIIKEKVDEKEEEGNDGEKVVEVEKKRIGAVLDEELIKLRPAEKKKIDWKNKLYLAPLTTVSARLFFMGNYILRF